MDGLVFHAAGEVTTRALRITLTAAYRSIDELACAEASDPNVRLVLGSGLYRGDS